MYLHVYTGILRYHPLNRKIRK
uniref:Uncharacterized protein n=1 Tax=Anguilla anguilla TaxID=7936 RepID=A0A0E9VRQ0_ANGAN